MLLMVWDSKITVVVTLGALSYPVLLFLVLGTAFSPLNPASSWGLAAEHGELELEHWSHFMIAVLAAFPLVVASRFVPSKVVQFLVLSSSLATALPYATQPTHRFEANDGWLANYTWQLGALEVALAPLLLAATIGAIAGLRGRERQSAA